MNSARAAREIVYDVLVTGGGKIVLAGSIGRPAASVGPREAALTAGSTKGSASTARSPRRWARGRGQGDQGPRPRSDLVGGSGDGAFAILAFTKGGRLDSVGPPGSPRSTSRPDRVLDIRRAGGRGRPRRRDLVTPGTPVNPVHRLRHADAAFGVRTASGFGDRRREADRDGGLIVAGRASGLRQGVPAPATTR